MSKLKKLWGMAKDSYQEQQGVSRAIEGRDELDARAARIEERGRKMPGLDGVFGGGESVLAVANQEWTPSHEHDDKVNTALTALSEKLTGDVFEVIGTGHASNWPHDGNALIVLTDKRLLLLKKEKRFTPNDVRYEVPADQLQAVAAQTSFKGERLRFSFTDGSTIEIPVEKTPVDAFELKFKTHAR